MGGMSSGGGGAPPPPPPAPAPVPAKETADVKKVRRGAENKSILAGESGSAGSATKTLLGQ